jgi:hypothetical protein
MANHQWALVVLLQEKIVHFLATGFRNLGWSGIFGRNSPHDTIFFKKARHICYYYYLPAGFGT